MADWSKAGLITKNVAYPAGVALFMRGAAMMFNGNWEVPTMVDAKAKNQLKFDYGIMSFPALYGATTQHLGRLAHPGHSQQRQDAPQRRETQGRDDLYRLRQQAGRQHLGGRRSHSVVPATQASAAYKGLQPNTQYSATSAKDATLEPTAPIFGVGGPVYDAIGVNFTPVLLGQLRPIRALPS